MASRTVAPEATEDLRPIAIGLAPSTAFATLGRIRTSLRLLGRHPFIGGGRDADLGPDLRSPPRGGYVIVHRATPSVVTSLRVIDGRRDYPAIFRP